MNTQFTRARAKQISTHTNVIAQIEQLPQLKPRVANRVLLHVNLQPLAILLEMRKSSLAHQADRHDASCNAHRHARRLELLGSLPTVFTQNLRDGMAEVVLAGISRLSESFNLLELLAPDLIYVVVEC